MSEEKYPFFVYDIFERLRGDKHYFSESLQKQFQSHHGVLRIDVESSSRRLFEAHEFWLQDVERIENFEELEDGAEEFKLAAHLTYWIKRTSPIILMDAPKSDFENIESAREYHYKSGNEYSALKIGFDLCAFFVAGRKGSGLYKEDFQMNENYVLTMCHFLKAKNVSPHALFLIFMSLFFDPLQEARAKGQI